MLIGDDVTILSIDGGVGFVGIGITPPATMLDIRENTGKAIATVGRTDQINAAAVKLGSFDFFNSDISGLGAGVAARIQALTNDGNGAGGTLQLFGKTTNTALTEIIRFDLVNKNGRFAIGTTNDGDEGFALQWGFNTGAKIINLQDGSADPDVQGLRFYTHPSATQGDAEVLAVTISANQKVTFETLPGAGVGCNKGGIWE